MECDRRSADCFKSINDGNECNTRVSGISVHQYCEQRFDCIRTDNAIAEIFRGSCELRHTANLQCASQECNRRKCRPNERRKLKFRQRQWYRPDISKKRATQQGTCASACTICSFIFSWDQRRKFINEIYLQPISAHVCVHRVHKVPSDFSCLRRLWCSCPEREHECMAIHDENETKYQITFFNFQNFSIASSLEFELGYDLSAIFYHLLRRDIFGQYRKWAFALHKIETQRNHYSLDFRADCRRRRRSKFIHATDTRAVCAWEWTEIWSLHTLSRRKKDEKILINVTAGAACLSVHFRDQKTFAFSGRAEPSTTGSNEINDASRKYVLETFYGFSTWRILMSLRSCVIWVPDLC